MSDWRIAVIVWAFGVVLGVSASNVIAQEHQHPTETIDAGVGRFYETWWMRDRPTSSCCSRKDCYATEVKYENGDLYAKRREDGKWLRVPKQKVEQNYRDPRESPDGRNHMCAPPPESHHPANTVFCLTLGTMG